MGFPYRVGPGGGLGGAGGGLGGRVGKLGTCKEYKRIVESCSKIMRVLS